MRVFDNKTFRFALVGGATAGAYVVLFLALLELGVARFAANAVAFGCAVLLQYTGHALFTFDRKLAHGGQISRFAIMISLGFVASAILIGPFAQYTGAPDWSVAALVTVYLPVQNYILLTLWVFASPLEKTDPLS